MRVTIRIENALHRKAKRLAARDKTTLRDLVESGLRSIVAERKQAHIEGRDHPNDQGTLKD